MPLAWLARAAVVGTALAGTTLLAPSSAQAGVSVAPDGTVTFTYDENFTSTNPSSTSPFLTAVIKNITNGVRIELTSSLETAAEFFGEVRFNVEPTLGAQPVVIGDNCISGGNDAANALCNDTTYQYSENNAGGSYGGLLGFDFASTFPTANSGPRFNGVDTFAFDFTTTGPQAITAGSFLATNDPRTGNGQPNTGVRSDVCTAAHLQGIPGGLSTAVGVSTNGLKCSDFQKAPGPLPLLGVAAAFGYSRRIRTRIQSARQQATIS